jgi:hypothetical protein
MRGWNHPAALIKEHTMELLLVAGFVFGYGLFVAVRTGLHRRLPLALGRISLETIPERAARMHGERTLFTSETPSRRPSIITLPFSTFACTVRVKHDGTQLPAALIALRTGMEISRERLGVELNGMLEGDRRLTRVDIVPWHEFPIGITGKTLKRVLRERTEVGETREANRPLVLAVESRLEEQASLVTL